METEKLIKKLLSVVLSVLLTVTTLPTFAFRLYAEGEAVAKIGDTEYTNFDEALDKWGVGETLTLLANVESTQQKVIEGNGCILNLGDFTWTAKNENTLWDAIKISGDGGLTINSGEEGGITVARNSCIYADGSNPLYIKGGTYNGTISVHSSAENTMIYPGVKTMELPCVAMGKKIYFEGVEAIVYDGEHYNYLPAAPQEWEAKVNASAVFTHMYAEGAGPQYQSLDKYDFYGKNKVVYFANADDALLLYTDLPGDALTEKSKTYYADNDKTFIADNCTFIFNGGATSDVDLTINGGHTVTIDASASSASYNGKVVLKDESAKFVEKYCSNTEYADTNVTKGGNIDSDKVIAIDKETINQKTFTIGDYYACQVMQEGQPGYVAITKEEAPDAFAKDTLYIKTTTGAKITLNAPHLFNENSEIPEYVKATDKQKYDVKYSEKISGEILYYTIMGMKTPDGYNYQINLNGANVLFELGAAEDKLVNYKTFADAYAVAKNTNNPIILLDNLAPTVELGIGDSFIVELNGFTFTDTNVTAIEGYKVVKTVNEDGTITYSTEEVEYVAQIVGVDGTTIVKKYADLQTAVNEATDGQTVQMLANINLDAKSIKEKYGVLFPAGKKISFDLNGHKLEGGSGFSDTYFLIKTLADELTLKDSSENKTGMVSFNASATSIWYGSSAISVYGGKTIVESGNYINSPTSGGAAYVFDVSNNEHAVELVINGGKFDCPYGDAVIRMTLQGWISSNPEENASKLTINDGIFTGGAGESVIWIDVETNKTFGGKCNPKCDIVINNGSFIASSDKAIFDIGSGSNRTTDNLTIIVNNGQFKSGADYIFGYRGAFNDELISGIDVKGGIYSTDKCNNIPDKNGLVTNLKLANLVRTEGRTVIANNDENTKDTYPWAIDEAVAKVVSGNTTTYYISLEKAIEVAEANDTVTLLKNVTIDKQLNIDKIITFEGNDKTITRTPGGANATQKAGILVTTGARINNLTVSGPNTTASGWDEGEFGIKFYQASGATLNNVIVKDANAGIQVNGGSVTMTGTINVSGNEFGGIEVCHNGALNLTSATLVCTDEADSKPVLWNDDTKGTITQNTNQPLWSKASGEDKDHYYLSVAKIGDVFYPSLESAIAEVKDNETIFVLTDIDDAIGLKVDTKKTFTIDFDNHTYTVTAPAAGSSGTKNQAFQILQGQNVTMKNGTVKIGASNLESTDGKISRVIQNYADLTLDNMKFDDENLAWRVNSQTAPGTLTSDAMIECDNGAVNLVNGTTLTIKEENRTSRYALAIEDWNSSYPKGSQVVVNGATINGNIRFYSDGATGSGLDSTLTIKTNTLNGKIYDNADSVGAQKISETINNYELCAVEPNVYVIGEAVAEIVNNDKTIYYESLRDAVSCSNDGDTIVMLKDSIETNSSIVEKDIVIDLNGKHVTVDNNWKGVKPTRQAIVYVKSDGKLTVNDSTENGSIDGSANSGVYAGVIMTVGNDNDASKLAELVVNSGTIKGYYYGICTNGERHNTKITINGGNIIGQTSIYHPDRGQLFINGGRLEGYDGIAIKGGTPVTITGGSFVANGDKVVPEKPATSGINGVGSALYVEGNYGYGAVIKVSDGFFKTKDNIADAVLSLFNEESTATISLSGGYYSNKVDDSYVAPGYECIPTPASDNNRVNYPYMIRSKIVTPEGDLEVKIDTDSKQNEATVSEQIKDENEKNIAKELAGKINGSSTGENKSEVVDLTETVGNLLNSLDMTKVQELAEEKNKKTEFENLISNAEEAAKTKNVEVTMNVTTDVDVEVTDVKVEQKTGEQGEPLNVTRFALDITPYYTLTVESKTTNGDDEPVVESVQIVTKDKLDVPETTTVTFPAPENFTLGNDDKLFVIHEKESGAKYTYPATYDATTKMITFVNPDGFSEFTLVKESKNVVAQNVQTEVFYSTLEDALDAAETNQTIILVDDDQTADANKSLYIDDGITLDLCGYDVNVKHLTVFGTIKDTIGNGVLTAAKRFIYPKADEKTSSTDSPMYIPVKQAENTESYKFYAVTVYNSYITNLTGEWTDDSGTQRRQAVFGSSINKELIETVLPLVGNVKLGVRINVAAAGSFNHATNDEVDGTGNITPSTNNVKMDIYFSDDIIEEYVDVGSSSNQKPYVTWTGIANWSSMELNGFVTSESTSYRYDGLKRTISLDSPINNPYANKNVDE